MKPEEQQYELRKVLIGGTNELYNVFSIVTYKDCFYKKFVYVIFKTLQDVYVIFKTSQDYHFDNIKITKSDDLKQLTTTYYLKNKVVLETISVK